ncbi:MAG: ABC transporter ATP-binding protein [Clostridiaceae bacterium]
MSLSIKNLTVSLDRSVILDHISLDVPAGSLFTLLGPSGCGKSTLLKTIAGLIRQDQGEITWKTTPLTSLPPEKRGMIMIFQDLRLFPHLSVLDNVAFSLKMAGLDKTTRYRAATDMLAMVHLQGLESRKPHQLSGGQQQRAVLARALVANPRVLLLDEPFSSLDAPLRSEMRGVVKELHETLGTTMILVTHDREEALAMSDAMAVMAPGQILQTGTPREIYQDPTSLAVAKQIVSGVIIEGVIQDGSFQGGGLRFSAPKAARPGPASALLPPQAVTIDPRRGPFQVTSLDFAGDHYNFKLSNDQIELETVGPTNSSLRVGDFVTVALKSDLIYVFPQS